MDLLKLIAFDAEDLQILSAHLQDAAGIVGDITYLPREKRFVAVLNRFDWASAHAKGGREMTRRRAALRFERVLAVRSTGINRGARETVIALLAVAYEPAAEGDPAGTVTLTFAGDAAMQLDVECIEVELRDLGPAWQARGRPRHPIDEGSGSSGA